MYGFKDDGELKYFDKFIDLQCNENKNTLVALTELKRENEALYRQCVNCQRQVEAYAERRLRTDGQKPQITKSNYKELLTAAQQISELGGKL